MYKDDTVFGRVEIPVDAPVSPSLRTKWQGKIVGLYPLCDAWCSLEGRQDEGIMLTCPDAWVRELTSDETRVAELLEATFWHRTSYTEDLALLKTFKRG